MPAFTKFKALVENVCGCQVKVLRTDHGGEFLSADFTWLCEDTGIEKHAPYTPQQNGAVEWRNRSVIHMSRYLLKSINVRGR